MYVCVCNNRDEKEMRVGSYTNQNILYRYTKSAKNKFNKNVKK